jgi:serine/threonine protein kinase
MGEVYRARDTRLDRIVAVKILPEHLSSNPQLRERFEREARAISSLSHPHICSLYDVGQQNGIDYLVMEHLEGETLAGRLKKGPLPADQVLQYAIQITDALDTAHKHAVVHRDLKPGNIMLTKTGAKLLDFGLAKVRGAAAAKGMTALPTQTTPLTGEGTILGTLQYMAPEQSRPAQIADRPISSRLSRLRRQSTKRHSGTLIPSQRFRFFRSRRRVCPGSCASSRHASSMR